jgi:hypothetical protein
MYRYITVWMRIWIQLISEDGSGCGFGQNVPDSPTLIYRHKICYKKLHRNKKQCIAKGIRGG